MSIEFLDNHLCLTCVGDLKKREIDRLRITFFSSEFDRRMLMPRIALRSSKYGEKKTKIYPPTPGTLKDSILCRRRFLSHTLLHFVISAPTFLFFPSLPFISAIPLQGNLFLRWWKRWKTKVIIGKSLNVMHTIRKIVWDKSMFFCFPLHLKEHFLKPFSYVYSQDHKFRFNFLWCP